MTELVTVPAAPVVPPFPALGDPNFNQLAYDNGSAMPGVSAGLQAIALTAFTNATVAGEKAAEAALSKAAADADAIATAADRVQTGLDRVQTGADRAAAAASAVQASKLNLGNKSTPPTMDNQGAALLAGATYYDTTLGKWRVWTGSAWGEGISAVAGVTSVNGTTGAVTAIATTGANTFTGAQELPTGTAIASAATINLNTATGNRVHITGTTTITSVTLTRGPRTVIFADVLTLTHHATNNNLPGVANITTAAGDRAIYESDGTTVYCVSYTRASGVAVVDPVTGDHEYTLTTGNGFGSTNTMIRKFSTVARNVGTAITGANSATLGASVTINEDGIYSVFYSDFDNAVGQWYGISLNSSSLNTQIIDINNYPQRLASNPVVVGTRHLSLSVTRRFAVNDVIRPHTSGIMAGSNTTNIFSVVRVGI